jgi:nucleoid-associated protein YejK
VVTNKYFKKKKRQARLSVFLFEVFSERSAKDAKQSLARYAFKPSGSVVFSERNIK